MMDIDPNGFEEGQDAAQEAIIPALFGEQRDRERAAQIARGMIADAAAHLASLEGSSAVSEFFATVEAGIGKADRELQGRARRGH